MATISRQTTWASIQILTASALNAEFNNIVNAWNNQDAGTSRWTVTDASTFKKGGTTVIPILQVVSNTTTTQVTSTSGTYADSTLTASITPATNTSKILVLISQDCGANAAVNTLRLLRGASTLISDFTAIENDPADFTSVAASLLYLDSPASAAALTYKTQFSRASGAGTAYVQPNSIAGANLSTIMLVELGY